MRIINGLVLCVLGAIVPWIAVSATQQTVNAPIKQVTVYANMARVVRSAVVNMPAGDHTVLIENLPNNSDPNSFRVEIPGESGVTMINFRQEAKDFIERSKKDVSALLRERDSLALRRDEIYDRRKAFEAQRGLLGAFQEAVSRQIRDGNIEIPQWDAAFRFMGNRTNDVEDSLRVTLRASEGLTERLKIIDSTVAAAGEGVHRSSRSVLIDVQAESAATCTLLVSYMMPGANWTPSYDARLSADGKAVSLTAYAQITQATGEAWDSVSLTLSTSTPGDNVGPGPYYPTVLNVQGSSYRGGGDGRIAGRIVDKETGDGIIGASIAIVGTHLGAMTDTDGRYAIVGLTPGMYTARISSLDYRSVEVTDVNVKRDETIAMDQEMVKSSGDLNKTITVSGTRDIIDKFEVSGQVSISQETKKFSPKRTVDNLLQQVAGVQTTSSGEVFIRGGRAGEIGYLVGSGPIGDQLGGVGRAGRNIKSAGASSFTTIANLDLNAGMPVTFAARRLETVKSGKGAVRVVIGQWDLTAETKMLARPQVLEGVYRVVTITNQNTVPLLAGSVALFTGTEYIGSGSLISRIPQNAEFELPFGREDQITVDRRQSSIVRDRDKDDTKIDQLIRFTFTNHSVLPSTLRLEEPLPVSQDSRIKVRLDLEKIPKPEVDYQGKAIWTITLAPGQTDSLAVPIHVSFPSSVRISGL